MQHERLRGLLARLHENHGRALELLEDAREAVSRAAETQDAAAGQRERLEQCRRRRPDRATLAADLRELAQRGRAVMEERREILEQVTSLTRPAG